jgi:hypothetical protein
VAAQHSDGISASWRRSCEAELAFIGLWAAVREGFGPNFNLTRVLQDHSICAMLVERCAAFNRLETDDAGAICEERVDPPAVAPSAYVEVSTRGHSLSRPPLEAAEAMGSLGMQVIWTSLCPPLEECLGRL